MQSLTLDAERAPGGGQVGESCDCVARRAINAALTTINRYNSMQAPCANGTLTSRVYTLRLHSSRCIE